MPIYEYHCSGCNNDFEITQKITDAPLSECPKCQGRVEKLISHSSFVLKGAGWYATDYAGKKAPEEKKESGASCENSGSKPACQGCPGSGD